jgi:hypothetical protein
VTYQRSLSRAAVKALEEARSPFIVVDAPNLRLDDFKEVWAAGQVGTGDKETSDEEGHSSLKGLILDPNPQLLLAPIQPSPLLSADGSPHPPLSLSEVSL